MTELVVYDTLGFPTEEDFLRFMVGAERKGSWVLEVGIPPKFAKYDGPVIRRSYRAVSKTLRDPWRLLENLRGQVKVPIVALTYLEDWLGNFNELLSTLRKIGIDGVLFPDLTVDFPYDVEKITEKVRTAGIKNVIFVTPTVPDTFIQRVSKLTDLFLYYGVRPTTGVPIPISLEVLLQRIRNLVDTKLVVGFGLSNEEDIRKAVAAGVDGIAIGTMLIEEIEKKGVEGALALLDRFVVSIRGP